MAVPGKVTYAPDARSITYLFSPRGNLTRELWRMDLRTGEHGVWLSPPGAGVTEETVSREEALRRERQRVRETGITEFAWAEKAAVLILPVGGALFRWSDGGLTRVAGGATDAQISRDGRRIFFNREAEVWCDDEAGTRRLTSGSAPGITNGLAEFIAQEELERHTGYWPSPDGSLVAFARVDERHIPVYPIVHQGTDTVEVEEHRYPFAGAANARVELAIVSAGGGSPVSIDLGPDGDMYLARADWHPDGRLFVQVLSRDQRRLELRAYTEEGGRGTCLLVEESDRWINLHRDLRFIEATGEFVWASERTGFKHLYLYDRAGRLLSQLTGGDWLVDEVEAVDGAGRQVYFGAGMETPVERQVYRVALDGGDEVRLTAGSGVHDAVFAPDFSSFVDRFENRAQPPSFTIRRMDGASRGVLHPAAAVDVELRTPELHTFRTADGTVLHAAVYRPSRAGRAPVIVSVYGGPHAQMVTDSWGLTVDLRAQMLAVHGFVVLKVDNRGSWRRGKDFEAAIAGNMGDLEVADQVEGVRWLAAQGLADPSRVGIYGWSYGGYMTLMAMMKAPEIFSVGVAGAPVVSWDGYDTAYTERYMGLPASNQRGYRESSVLQHVHRLEGKLLLIHGLLDENVHFRHTARLMQALSAAGKRYDVLLYPNERHLPRSEADRVAMETRILEFFKQHL